MSNFSDNTFHPVTGKIEMAHWIDDHCGRHHYAVKFPNDDTYYDPFTDKCERVGPQAMKLISELEVLINEAGDASMKLISELEVLINEAGDA
jgi:hypothetical protein